MKTVYFVLLGSVCSQAAFASPPVGKAVSVSGKVLLRNELDQNVKMTVLKAGDSLLEGSIINTESGGTAKLLMTDKSIVDIGPSTLFKIDEYKLKSVSDRKVGMSMDYGKIRAAVNSPVGKGGKFTIRTKAATMGVRGTELVISTDVDAPKDSKQPPKTQVTVIHGLVEVRDAKTTTTSAPVMLKTGAQLTTAVDAGPKVVNLNSTELKQVQQSAIQKDATFIQSIAIENNSKDGSGNTPTSASASALSAVSDSFKAGSNIPAVNDLGLPGTFSGNMDRPFRPVETFLGLPITLGVTFKK